MAIFNLDAEHPFGTVQSVDTANIVISVFDSAMLSKLQVNHLIVIRSPKVGQSLIGLVTKIMRKYGDMQDVAEGEEVSSSDIVKVTLIGTLIDCYGTRNNVFKRTLESVPEIDADCYLMKEQMLANSRLGWYRRCGGDVVNYLLSPKVLTIAQKDRPGLVDPLAYYLSRMQ